MITDSLKNYILRAYELSFTDTAEARRYLEDAMAVLKIEPETKSLDPDEEREKDIEAGICPHCKKAGGLDWDIEPTEENDYLTIPFCVFCKRRV